MGMSTSISSGTRARRTSEESIWGAEECSRSRPGIYCAIEPVWEKTFEAGDTPRAGELRSELEAKAAELECVSWLACTGRREEVLARRE